LLVLEVVVVVKQAVVVVLEVCLLAQLLFH
jgi:hypothetical protein